MIKEDLPLMISRRKELLEEVGKYQEVLKSLEEVVNIPHELLQPWLKDWKHRLTRLVYRYKMEISLLDDLIVLASR